jgi:hypothetical protein
MGALWLIAALIAQAPPSTAGEQRSPPPGEEVNAVHHPKPPLSDEDRALVKQLALLEQMELVKNLELFEGDKQDKHPQAQQRQP